MKELIKEKRELIDLIDMVGENPKRNQKIKKAIEIWKKEVNVIDFKIDLMNA